MNLYRKHDKEYYDRYDRQTIQFLNKIEAEEAKDYPKKIKVKGKIQIAKECPFFDLHDEGVKRSREREETVKKWMKYDEECDKLVESLVIPNNNFKCDICNAKMYLNGHLFDTFDQRILFVFDCSNDSHKSRKIVYPNGEVMYVPKPKCEKCGHQITSSVKKKKQILLITDTCRECGASETYEFDKTPPKPITEADRKKYCFAFNSRSTYMEDMKVLSDLYQYIQKKEKEKFEKEEAGFDNVEKVSIPNIKERLCIKSKDFGFVEFAIEKPDFKKMVTIEFSIQDPTSRDAKESIKVLNKCFNSILLKTNWRHSKSTIEYRLGYLKGKLFAYEDYDNLLRIAKEIQTEEDKSS